MDPVNLIAAIILFLSMTANWGGARKGLKTSITRVLVKPDTFLQKIPPNVSAVVLILIILGIFNVGTFNIEKNGSIQTARFVGLGFFALFSWLQVYSYKSLGSSYAPDIVILKDHKLYTNGIYKVIRHPQYLSQILSDLGAGVALLSYLALPLILILEIPLLIMRASAEEKMLAGYFKEKFSEYKKRSGFIIPFIG